MDVQALIARQKQVLDNVEPVDQPVVLGDEAVTVRFWPLTGQAWRDLCAKHPAGTPFDEALGYNLRGVLVEYPRVYLVNGDDVEAVADQWADICAVLSGSDLKALEYAVWGMNEYEPAQKLASLGKASKGQPRKKRS